MRRWSDTECRLVEYPSNVIHLGGKAHYLKSLTDIGGGGIMIEAVDIYAGWHRRRPADHSTAAKYSEIQCYREFTIRGLSAERKRQWKKILKENGLPIRRKKRKVKNEK